MTVSPTASCTDRTASGTPPPPPTSAGRCCSTGLAIGACTVIFADVVPVDRTAGTPTGESEGGGRRGGRRGERRRERRGERALKSAALIKTNPTEWQCSAAPWPHGPNEPARLPGGELDVTQACSCWRCAAGCGARISEAAMNSPPPPPPPPPPPLLAQKRLIMAWSQPALCNCCWCTPAHPSHQACCPPGPGPGPGPGPALGAAQETVSATVHAPPPPATTSWCNCWAKQSSSMVCHTVAPRLAITISPSCGRGRHHDGESPHAGAVAGGSAGCDPMPCSSCRRATQRQPELSTAAAASSCAAIE